MNENKDKMLSLYDFLGYAAGYSLGEEVAQAANKRRINIHTKFISNYSYKGEVNMYPKSFLEYYFDKEECQI